MPAMSAPTHHPHLSHRPLPLPALLYTTTFLLTTLLLLALLLITPGDHIYQAFRRREIYHIFIVAGACALTAVVGGIVYVGRLLAVRRAVAGVMLMGVGVSWAGAGGEGEAGVRERMRIGGRKVGRRVEDVVAGGLSRSAGVAWRGLPKGVVEEEGEEEEEDGVEKVPTWGDVRHPGWSWVGARGEGGRESVQFEAVVVELGGLVEARAVSLAVGSGGEEGGDEDDDSREDGAEDEDEVDNRKIRNTHTSEEEQDQDQHEHPTTDEGQLPPQTPTSSSPSSTPATLSSPLLLNLLRRPTSMSLRDYLAHLTTLGMIHPPTLTPPFLALYERARFSGTAVEESAFAQLMELFAQILQGMRPVRAEVLEELRREAEMVALAAADAEAENARDHEKEIDAGMDFDDDVYDNDTGYRYGYDGATAADVRGSSNQPSSAAPSLNSTSTVNHRPPNPAALPPHTPRSFPRSSASSVSSASRSRTGRSRPRLRPRLRPSTRQSTGTTISRYISAESTLSMAGLRGYEVGSTTEEEDEGEDEEDEEEDEEEEEEEGSVIRSGGRGS